MKSTSGLFYAAAATIFAATIFAGPTSAFVNPRRASIAHHSRRSSDSVEHNILQIRGGDINLKAMPSALSSAVGPATDALHRALTSASPLVGVGALFVVSSLAVVPLTYYRYAYSFSVGYGMSIAAMSLALFSSFPNSASSVPSILAATSLVYGLRLAAFIFVRERTVESKKKAFDDMEGKTILQRTPLALSVSLFYALMMSPTLFALRGAVEAGSVMGRVQAFFTGVAVFGVILESVADQHKYEAKRQSKEGEDKFVGPTTWSYRLCRHPNYLGEILHYVGIFGAGSVSFGKSIVPWASGILGAYGIVSLMLGSSSRLDAKQSEKYAGQPAYDKWRGEVKSSVVPLFI